MTDFFLDRWWLVVAKSDEDIKYEKKEIQMHQLGFGNVLAPLIETMYKCIHRSVCRYLGPFRSAGLWLFWILVSRLTWSAHGVAL